MRKKIVAGNWKMNNSYAEAVALAADIKTALQQHNNSPVITILAPPFPFLSEVNNCIENAATVFTAAQNCHHENSGAFTGEVSAAMIKSTGATHVIIGHSERRQYFAETAEQLYKKLVLSLAGGLTPIFCIGETLEQRNSGRHFETVAGQLNDVAFRLDETDFSKLIIAYEPVWAIGTGVTASPEQAQEMHAFIRKTIAGKFGENTSAAASILYGGSCNATNAASLFALPDVDGGLIGGASLKAADFLAIHKAMRDTLGKTGA